MQQTSRGPREVASRGTLAAHTGGGPTDGNGRYVALTFDDGPSASTISLLDALTAAGVRATLFNIGSRVHQRPWLVAAQSTAGMWIGNHSWTHRHLTELSQVQISFEMRHTQQAIKRVTGYAPTLFRPPYGESGRTVRSAQTEFELAEVLWTVDSQDWNGASTTQIVRAADRMQAGDVLLMHDGIRTTVNAIPHIAANLRRRGLSFGKICPVTGRAIAPDA
jgi:peptidoglycan-N-acetylglucosamine deacetylase